MKKLTTSEFIQRAQEIHGNIYDYSLVRYINAHTKISITCKEHGMFKQVPDSHLRGRGCVKCADTVTANKNRLTTEKFIEKANKVHKEKYTYSKTSYIDSKTKVVVICPDHGEFKQAPDKHLQKQGCPKCTAFLASKRMKSNNPGWTSTNWKKAGLKSNNFTGFKVYIIRCWNDDEEFYKIGKTFTAVKKRFNKKKTLPYNYEIVKIFEGTAKEMSKLEKDLHKKHKKESYTPKLFFEGMTECYNTLI